MQVSQGLVARSMALGRAGVVAAIAVVLGAQSPTSAQVVRSQPMFTDVTLAPRFIPDPTQVRGLSGGEVYTEDVAGRLQTETGSCVGFVSEKPDHELTLTEFFRYLNLQVVSRADTVLLVRGPGGTWCSDDRTQLGPSIAGQWMPGNYEIWVGSLELDQYVPYQLQFTEAR